MRIVLILKALINKNLKNSKEFWNKFKSYI